MNRRKINDVMAIISREPEVKAPDYSKLSDDEVRALYVIQKRLEIENLPRTVDSLTPNEVTVLTKINKKL